MANTYRLIITLLCFLPSFAYSQAAEVGTIDLAGWIKNPDGVYSRAFSDGNGTRSASGNTLTSTSVATVNTSKGLVPFEITKTGSFDIPRIGKAIGKVAIASGPVGLTISTVSLICELSNICNQAGQWMAEGVDPYPNLPNSYPSSSGKWSGWTTNGQMTYYPTPETACGDPERIKQNCGATGFVFDHIEATTQTTTYKCYCKRSSDNAVFYASNTNQLTGCSTQYTLSGTDCVKSGVTQPHVATANDWDSKATTLNDLRFIPELLEKAADLPTGIPTLTPDQKKRLGVDSEPTKDAQGNITGRQETITEISAVDAGTSDKPGNVIIKETKTTIKYDTNNTQISTNTSTSYTNQPETVKPTGFEIKFDEIGQATISNYNVPSTFNANSWGTGTCPPDIEISLTNFTFSIPTSPICNFAEMIKPFVLMLASLLGVYIIAGVRGGSK